MTIEDDRDDGQGQCLYFIDMDWYEERGRSFALLVASRLCPSSQKKKIPKTQTGLLNTIKQCCSKWEGFATPDMPIQEMVFRVFLANSNRPLTLEQIQEKLQMWLGDSSGLRDISVARLKRIVDHDRYYGLKPVPVAEEEEASALSENR
jgi:hypothetical protein